MSEPTKWTMQQRIDNLANQMDLERKAREREKITAIWLRQEGKDIVVLFEREGKWYQAIREYEGTAFSHIIEAGGIREAKLDVLFDGQKCPICNGIEGCDHAVSERAGLLYRRRCV